MSVQSNRCARLMEVSLIDNLFNLVLMIQLVDFDILSAQVGISAILSFSEFSRPPCTRMSEKVNNYAEIVLSEFWGGTNGPQTHETPFLENNI